MSLRILILIAISIPLTGCWGLAAWVRFEEECPQLEVSEMLPEISAPSTYGNRSISFLDIDVSQQQVHVYTAAPRSCWLNTGIPHEIVAAVLGDVLKTQQLWREGAKDAANELQVKVISLSEKEHIRRFGDYSMTGRLEMHYQLVSPETNLVLWEKTITSISTVSYGPRATGENLTNRKQGSEHKKLIEMLIKENLTFFIKSL